MHPEEQGQASYTQDPRRSHGSQFHNQGRMSHQQEHNDGEDKRHSIRSDAKSAGSSEDEERSSRGSYRSAGLFSRPSQHQSQINAKHTERSSVEYEHRGSKGSADYHPTTPSHGHVHFKERAMTAKSVSNLPPLPPGLKPQTSDSDEVREDLARASWTTASFTEVPNALEELTHQHHPATTSPKEQLPHVIPTEPEKKPPQTEPSSADLHSILVKHGQPNPESILTKYLRPTMMDEGTQAGVPAWDWLTRLEQMLIHFFLMVFESSGESSKLIMEMMSTEAGSQIEEIFQLLLKAEPDMYKELGNLVTLAEKWLIHWKGDSEQRHRALEYVRLYMKGVKDKNYYTLPIQVRLHKLGSFIAGLKIMGRDAPTSLPPVRYPTYQVRPPVVQENQFRVGSPRVKPATHFSQVVANILCGRPCNDPLPKATVYADPFGRHMFKNTLHGDKEFKNYTDKKYGRLYQRRELFSKEFPRLESIDFDAAGDVFVPIPDRSDCVENAHCWIPKYTKSYVNTLEDKGCEILAKADFEKSRKVKDCRLGKGNNEAFCRSIKASVKPKKLYDWVRGPDGKVHRRVVGSYTELGKAASMSNVMGSDAQHGGHSRGGGHGGHSGGGGRGGHSGGGRAHGVGGAKMGKKGYYPKAVSDTRLGGNLSQGTRKTQTTRPTSKGRYVYTSREKLDNEGKDRKSKNTNTMNLYKVDGISLDGSGDSGQEDEHHLKKDKVGGQAGKSPKDNKKSVKGNSSRFGANYHGPSNYKPRKQHEYGTSDVNKDSNTKKGRRGRPGETSMDRRDKSFVNIFDKSKRQTTQIGRRNIKNFKRGRFRMNAEWGGEGSPGDSDYDNFMDKDDKHQNIQLLTVNQCWEKASKLFKKPSKALVIPPAENLLLYLEKKYTKAKWPRGNPVASRNYPNGSVFVAHYGNGSSTVFYPHGGLAVAISGASPVTSQVLVVRDPSDQVFFFDKALLAELNSSGKGIIYGEDGVIKAQYSALGGFKLDNLENGRRWHWNQGGQRMLLKLNKYMSLRISDQDKIFLKFFGNHRGFLVNVASGHEVSLMNVNSQETKVDPILDELRHLIRPRTKDDNFDYVRGRFTPRPTLGFVDKAKHYANAERDAMGFSERSQIPGSYSGGGDYCSKDFYETFSPQYNGCDPQCGDTVSYMDNFPDCPNVNTDCGTILVTPIMQCCK